MQLTEPLKYQFTPLADSDPDDLNGGKLAAAKPRLWSEQEIEALRAAAMSEGDTLARASVAKSEEARRTNAFEAIAKTLTALNGNLADTFSTIERGATDLAVTIGSAIAEQALTEAPLSVVSPLLNESLARLADETRVTIAVHDSLVKPVQAGISDLAADAGFEGRVRITGGADHAADCRIDWGDGGIERCLASIKRTIADHLAQHKIVMTGPTAVEES